MAVVAGRSTRALAVIAGVTNEELWKRVDRAIAQARNRAETISELNRLFGKQGRGAPANHFSEENCTIRREFLTPQQLDKFWRGHTKAEPRQVGAPLVAVEFRGHTYMLDGTNRINAWLRDGNTEAHETISLSGVDNDG